MSRQVRILAVRQGSMDGRCIDGLEAFDGGCASPDGTGQGTALARRLPQGSQGRSSSATTGSREPGSAINRLCQNTGNGWREPTGSTASQPGNTVRSVGQ